MATTKRYTRTVLRLTNSGPSTKLFDAVRPAKRSSWSNAKTWYASLALSSSVFRFFCCISDEEIDEINLDAEIRDAVREEMTRHDAATDRSVVEVVATSVYEETGYDLTHKEKDACTLLEESCATSTIIVGDVACPIEGMRDVVMAPTERCEVTDDHVKVVPRFAAAMVVCMRAKFGWLVLNEANRLLIEREYLRVCREGHVRQKDVVHHAQIVLNTYFGEGVLDHVATSRSRVPAWLRKALGSPPVSAAVVC
jgi:hypothetical protein